MKKITEVNSFHNYTIDTLSNDFIISATNEGSIIKAIEHKRYKLLGVMWHSERESIFNENELDLMQYFFNDNLL